MRDLRTMNMSAGQKIESDLVMKRIGDLAYRDLGVMARMSLFDAGKALIVGDGLRVAPSSGMTVVVPSGSVFQRCIDVYPCLQIEDQTVTLDAASGVPRIDIVEAQVKVISDRADVVQVAGIGSGSSIEVTTEEVKRDIRYYLSVRKQTDTTEPTPATAAELEGSVAIAGTIDLSNKYLLNLMDGEDGDFIEIDCRGATPEATTRAEIITAINSAVGRAMATTGSGNVIVLTGAGVGQASAFSVKPPVTDADVDCLQVVFGLSAGGAYVYNYAGDNGWFKLAEIDVGASTTIITTPLIRNIDQKSTWSDGSDIKLFRHLFSESAYLDTISEYTAGHGTSFNDNINILDATASTSISSGCGVFAGGVGIAGSEYLGGNLNIAGSEYLGGVLYADTINEKTLNAGVTIEGITLKDGYVAEPLGINIAPVAGTNLHVHQLDGGASLLRFTNSTTGATATDGFEVGIDADEQGRIWNYENTDLVIGTNNTAYLTLDNAGVITPAVPFSTINIQSATTPQVRIAYDGTYYKTLTITSAGFMGFNVTTPYTDFQFNGKLRIATANNSGILSLGESGATVINVGIWRGLSNSLTGGNVLNLGGYAGIQLAVGSAEIGSQTSAMTIGNTGIVSLLNTTECTGAGTGALQVSGGADFAKHVNMQTNLTVGTGIIVTTGNIVATKTITGSYVYTGVCSVFNTATDFTNPGHMITGIFSAAAPDDNISRFITFGDNAAQRFIVYSDGDVVNHDNSYGAISDEKLKENIVDTNDVLSKILKIKVRDFNFKTDNKEKVQTGMIAQEVEKIFPKFVKESKDGEDSYKILAYSKFIPVLIKAIQEQQKIIDKLKN